MPKMVVETQILGQDLRMETFRKLYEHCYRHVAYHWKVLVHISRAHQDAHVNLRVLFNDLDAHHSICPEVLGKPNYMDAISKRKPRFCPLFRPLIHTQKLWPLICL